MPLFHCIPPSLLRHVSFLTSCPYFTVLFIHQPPNYQLHLQFHLLLFYLPIPPIHAFIFIFLVFFLFYTYFCTSCKFSSEFFFPHQFWCFSPCYAVTAHRNYSLRLSFCYATLHIDSLHDLHGLPSRYIHP